jgi:hypothetical protein
MMLRPGRQAGQGPTEGGEHAAHQHERSTGKGSQLFVGLVGVGEEPGKQLEQDLIPEVE